MPVATLPASVQSPAACTKKTDAPVARPLLSGGARRDRTADLYNAIVALSQLSYGPMRAAKGGEGAN